MLKNIRNKMQDDKGFTLIELMVVVLIIAILIAIAIPTFLGLRRRAQDRAAQSDLRNGLTAAKAYFTDCDSFAPPATCNGGQAFNAAQGLLIEPSLQWVDGAPAVATQQIGVQGVTALTVALSRHSQSGATFCLAENAQVGVHRGSWPNGSAGGAATYAACVAAPATW
jgi:type IV pilus assembly protein PilA